MGSNFISKTKRSHSCGALKSTDIGQEVVLFGWVHRRRDHGALIFVDLRDRDGLTQIVFDPDFSTEAHIVAQTLRNEWVIGVKGKVRSRGMQWSKKENKAIPAVNPNLRTGEIEVLIQEIEIFNKTVLLPFEVDEQVTASEEKRLTYRYLDLRRPSLQKTLMTRSKVHAVTRAYFVENGFLELETPYMARYTPGGARNFLVPSRLNPGKFYALAESPQLYKQLFMVAGFDRYFQIVKCFRDEDLRIDRQPEFTQIDMEMSFVNQEDIFTMIEGLIKRLWKVVHGLDIPTPFPRMNYDDAMARYGNDKPDLRFEMPHIILNEVLKKSELTNNLGVGIRDVLQSQDGLIKAMLIPAQYQLSRKDIDELDGYVRGIGSAGLGRAKVGQQNEWSQAPLFKHATRDLKAAIEKATNAKPGDLILFQFGPMAQVNTIMANLRVQIAKKLKLIPVCGSGGKWQFLWVVNPPLFERDETTNAWTAAHHAFTRPVDECLKYLEPESIDLSKVYCYRYDVVLNGFELGGGSIRLHDPEIQEKVFQAIGISAEDARSKFGFFLDALQLGAPPHGGIALGMDRLAFLITEAESLRDVIPFPKTLKGIDLLTGAPSDVAESQLRSLHVKSTVQ